MTKRMKPLHPGEILLKEFMEPMELSQYRLAKDIGVTQMRISEIIRNKRAISADTGLRLSKYFELPESFWLGLQADYEIDIAKGKFKKALDKVKPMKKVS